MNKGELIALIIAMEFLVLSFIFGISMVSAGTIEDFNISTGQQELICTNLSFSFIQCYDFWTSVENATIIEIINVTEITETFNESCAFEDDFALIEAYQSIGYEPVILRGEIINFGKAEESCEGFVSPSDVEQQKADQFARGQSACIVVPTPKDDDTEIPWLIIAFGVGALALSWKMGWIKLPIKQRSQTQKAGYPPGFQNPNITSFPGGTPPSASEYPQKLPDHLTPKDQSIFD